MTDPLVRRLASAVTVPGLCGDTLPAWLEREAGAGLRAVCWFGGAALAELRERVPDVIVLADEEGGTVTRLERSTGSSFPGHAALGAVDDTAITERVAAGIAAMARGAGVDVVLAPVVDVNSEPENPVIGVRSFGADPALVARHGAAFVGGVQSQGVAACAKHFPGHGATRTDSHLGLPVVDADRRTFLSRDVAPFAAAVDAGVRCVLTAHVSVPGFDRTPATMSPAWIRHLRDELGFDGVVISDALDMHAIAHGVGRRAGAVAAVRAGVDLIAIGNPCYPEPYDGETVFAAVRDAIVQAVAGGTVGVTRLEQAVDRVSELSAWLRRRTIAGGEQLVADASAVGLEAARRAIRVDGDVRLALPPHVVIEERSDIAAGRSRSPIAAALAARLPATTSQAVRSAADVSFDGIDPSRPLIVVTDGLVDGVVNAVRAVRPDAIVVHTGPANGTAVDPPAVYTRGNGAATAAAVAEVVVGT